MTPLTGRSNRMMQPNRSGPRWMGLLLVAGGIAFGYLLAQGTTSGVMPADPDSADILESASGAATPVAAADRPSSESVSFPGTNLASVEFGRGLVARPGDGDPINVRLASDASAAEYDAAQDRIAVTLPEYDGDQYALHIGSLGDLRFVTSGVTGFVWHSTDPSAIAWVEESDGGFALVKASVSTTT